MSYNVQSVNYEIERNVHSYKQLAHLPRLVSHALSAPTTTASGEGVCAGERVRT